MPRASPCSGLNSIPQDRISEEWEERTQDPPGVLSNGAGAGKPASSPSCKPDTSPVRLPALPSGVPVTGRELEEPEKHLACLSHLREGRMRPREWTVVPKDIEGHTGMTHGMGPCKELEGAGEDSRDLEVSRTLGEHDLPEPVWGPQLPGQDSKQSHPGWMRPAVPLPQTPIHSKTSVAVACRICKFPPSADLIVWYVDFDYEITGVLETTGV